MDPDFLMTEFISMDFTSSRTGTVSPAHEFTLRMLCLEFSFWSIWSAPLLVSTDIRKLSDKKRSILLNPEVIAVNQDPSGTAADRVRNDTTGAQLWARPLANGDKVVLLYNSASKQISVGVHWDEIGWSPNQTVKVRDLWGKKDAGVFVASINRTLAPHDVAMFRLTKIM